MAAQIPAHAVKGLTTSGSGAVTADATSVTPAGSVAATDVQAALEELASRIDVIDGGSL